MILIVMLLSTYMAVSFKMGVIKGNSVNEIIDNLEMYDLLENTSKDLAVEALKEMVEQSNSEKIVVDLAEYIEKLINGILSPMLIISIVSLVIAIALIIVSIKIKSKKKAE